MGRIVGVRVEQKIKEMLWPLFRPSEGDSQKAENNQRDCYNLDFLFHWTSSYAAIGLQTAPIGALADDLKVGGFNSGGCVKW